EPSAAEGPERQLEQSLGETDVRPGQADSRGRIQAPLVAEIDREPVDVEELADPGDGRFERMRNGQLGDRLADDGEERPRALELSRECPRAGARTQCVCGSDTECRELAKLRVGRSIVRSKEQLQRADRRMT